MMNKAEQEEEFRRALNRAEGFADPRFNDGFKHRYENPLEVPAEKNEFSNTIVYSGAIDTSQPYTTLSHAHHQIQHRLNADGEHEVCLLSNRGGPLGWDTFKTEAAIKAFLKAMGVDRIVMPTKVPKIKRHYENWPLAPLPREVTPEYTDDQLLDFSDKRDALLRSLKK